MPNIFLTHSQYDTTLPNIFDKAAGMTDISLLHVEWEQLITPPWKFVRDKLKNSEAIFILKGSNIARSLYTSNWVSYELGLAAHSSKNIGEGEMDVWVFESVESPVFFPIPFLTDYVIYDPNDTYHLQYIRDIVEGYYYKRYKHRPPQGLPVKCWHDECNIEYNLHTVVNTWNCPSCQRFGEWTGTEPVSYPEEALTIPNSNIGIMYPNVAH